MASFSIASNNGPFLLTQEKSRLSIKNSTSSWGAFASPSCSSISFSGFSNSQQRLLIDENGKTTQTHLRKRDISRFSLRFKPRLRLLSVRFRKASSVVVIVSILDGIGPFIRKNIRKMIIPASISLAFGLSFLFLKLTAIPSPKAVPYSDLVSNLQHGIVSKVLFEEGTRRIYYNSDSWNADTSQNEVDIKAKPQRGCRASKWEYSTRKIDHDESYLLSLMREKGTMYSSAPQSLLMSMRSILITVISLWIPLTPLMWLLYRQLSSANSPAKKRRPSTNTVSFDDVEGVDAAKVELMEIVSCLQGDINYNKLGAKLPRGVLLVGPPGTGKTLLARAVAGEAGVPFFSVSASEFVELFVGRGAARIRDLFSVARKNSPSIIFIDELDAVGGKRGRSFNDERDQTLNQLLTEMDGFNSDMKVVVIAATNRPEALDAALCRPGRFSRKVFVGEPDEDGRRKILGVHLREVPLDEDSGLICSLVASLTQGFAGADLANIVNEAALLAARRGGECVSREDIMEAIERAKYGVNGKEARQSTLSKELGKLFPWMPLLNGKSDSRQDGFEGPLGYQTLS
ncbi:probable inactive ATP-dependent zinc metalloprotease FTSHI 3, chloroplastic [Impatiens glandulifera]|uniref:probable inactive ATP-dependent zinc metalloprotease FTSHI 3, chloroplastic n=1 Tax=Impatiens glandulifera TaxID=253017 RepID=UPI001FB1136E|nr:probable inactive ATP-dependent zinc metalloprotease FTSHI 3, chloroplastic [Impatiens glandulifera]